MVDQLIGVVSSPLDPWDDFGSERRRSERELFVSRGIPADWMPWSSALRWNFPPTQPLGDSPVELRVGGDSPPRTLSELVDAANRGMGLWIALPDGFDLSQLAPVIPKLGYFTVVSQGTVTGWEVLGGARRLEQLIVRCRVGRVVATAALPELRRVIGPREMLGLACAGPKLVELVVDMASKPWPSGLGVDAPIEYLEIARATKVQQPPQLEHPRELKTLRIHGARELDLSTLAPEVDLEWLEVDRTRVLRGADTIAKMKRLRSLDLENVASIPGAGALSAINARHVFVHRSDPAAAIALQR